DRGTEAQPLVSKAYKLFEVQDDRLGMAVALTLMGFGAKPGTEGRAEVATELDYQKRGIALIDPGIYRHYAAMSYLSCAIIYDKVDDYAQANQWTKKALPLARELGDE